MLRIAASGSCRSWVGIASLDLWLLLGWLATAGLSGARGWTAPLLLPDPRGWMQVT